MSILTSEKVEEKVEPKSPWASIGRADAAGRVVGWKDGLGITSDDRKDVLRQERSARHEYRQVRKANANLRSKAAEENLLKELPPTWQSFWSAVPYSDSQKSAAKAFEKQRGTQVATPRNIDRELVDRVDASQKNLMVYNYDVEMIKQREKDLKQPDAPDKKAVAKEDKKEQDPSDEVAADIEQDVARLEKEIRQGKELLEEKKRAIKLMARKLEKATQADKEEEHRSKKSRRILEATSRRHGILLGQMASSERYFEFLFLDQQKEHKTKVDNLNKSCSLMDLEIGQLKTEVHDMLRMAAQLHQGSSMHTGSKRLQSSGRPSGGSSGKGTKLSERASENASSKDSDKASEHSVEVPDSVVSSRKAKTEASSKENKGSVRAG